jgi:hypothetical protein
MTVSPDLSVVRDWQSESSTQCRRTRHSVQQTSGCNTTLDRNAVIPPTDNGLVVTVMDWESLALTVRSACNYPISYYET